MYVGLKGKSGIFLGYSAEIFGILDFVWLGYPYQMYQLLIREFDEMHGLRFDI